MQSRAKTLKIILITIISLNVFTSSPFSNAYDLEDGAICYGYDTQTYRPKGESVVFLTTSENAGAWVNISDPPEQIRFNWYKPNGDQYKSTVVDIIVPEGETWGIAFNDMPIHGVSTSLPWNYPGKWTVKGYVKVGDTFTEVLYEQDFQIIDYQELIDEISDIQEQVLGLIDSIQEVRDEKDTIVEQYELQIAEYETALESQSGITEDYEELENEYELLEDDVNDLQIDLNTTKLMMYIAVVIAIISIGVAVYFGALKR